MGGISNAPLAGLIALALTCCGRGGDIDLLPLSASGGMAGTGSEEPASAGSPTLPVADEFPTSRNATQWPFAVDSVWNTPIGDSAEYVPAEIAVATDSHGPLNPVEAIIVLEPEAPLLDVYYSEAGFSGDNRCAATGDLLFSAPIPSDFLVIHVSATPASALAVLMPDGRTLNQSQPFAHCEPDAPGTTKFLQPDVDLFGDGRVGSFGGSGLSALGGTLRVGELRPNSGRVRHALKVQLDRMMNLSACDVPEDCYRWPATHADGSATTSYGGSVPELRMGALLALPTSVSIEDLALETLPAQQLAWTLQNYGAYVVGSAGTPSYEPVVEHGPAGRFIEQFAADWGFDFETTSNATPWARDISTLFQALAVVNDNSEQSIGGAGERLQPLAPPLSE